MYVKRKVDWCLLRLLVSFVSACLIQLLSMKITQHMSVVNNIFSKTKTNMIFCLILEIHETDIWRDIILYIRNYMIEKIVSISVQFDTKNNISTRRIFSIYILHFSQIISEANKYCLYYIVRSYWNDFMNGLCSSSQHLLLVMISTSFEANMTVSISIYMCLCNSELPADCDSILPLVANVQCAWDS